MSLMNLSSNSNIMKCGDLAEGTKQMNFIEIGIYIIDLSKITFVKIEDEKQIFLSFDKDNVVRLVDNDAAEFLAFIRSTYKR